MNIDSIIFDLDGTLWDSTDAVLKAWNEVLKDKKEIIRPVTREMLQSIMGLQVKEIGVKLFPYMNEEQQKEIMELCLEKEKELLLIEGGVLYPKLELLLETLSKKYSLFIVSNCECGYIETFLEHHKLGKYFKDIECAGNTGLVKGKNIKRIMDRNNIKQAVYVGDTQGDCDAAKLANIPFVFASYGFGKVTAYDFIIEEIGDILEIL
jgi:phosphoglycolate phosphatase